MKWKDPKSMGTQRAQKGTPTGNNTCAGEGESQHTAQAGEQNLNLLLASN